MGFVEIIAMAVAASTASVPATWQPAALGDWQVGPYEGRCAMVLPLGPEGSGRMEGALTLVDRPDGLLAMTVTHAGWALPQERGTVQVWFDDGYGKLRPIYDHLADFDANEGNGMLITAVEADFLTIGSIKSSIDVVIDGTTLGDPQRITLPLGDLESAAERMDTCRAAT